MPCRLHDGNLALEERHVGRADRHEGSHTRDRRLAAYLCLPGGVQVGRCLEQRGLAGVVGLAKDHQPAGAPAGTGGNGGTLQHKHVAHAQTGQEICSARTGDTSADDHNIDRLGHPTCPFFAQLYPPSICTGFNTTLSTATDP